MLAAAESLQRSMYASTNDIYSMNTTSTAKVLTHIFR